MNGYTCFKYFCSCLIEISISGTRVILGRWVDPRTGLDNLERRKILPLPGFELGPLGRLARSQSLYALSYPGS
jgi:hypothetical protein